MLPCAEALKPDTRGAAWAIGSRGIVVQRALVSAQVQSRSKQGHRTSIATMRIASPGRGLFILRAVHCTTSSTDRCTRCRPAQVCQWAEDVTHAPQHAVAHQCIMHRLLTQAQAQLRHANCLRQGARHPTEPTVACLWPEEARDSASDIGELCKSTQLHPRIKTRAM